MDVFTNSATQATLANLMDQLKLLTNQLQSIQLHNDEFKAMMFKYTLPCVGIVMGLI